VLKTEPYLCAVITKNIQSSKFKNASLIKTATIKQKPTQTSIMNMHINKLLHTTLLYFCVTICKSSSFIL